MNSKFKIEKLNDDLKNTALIMSDLHLRPEEYEFAEKCLQKGLSDLKEKKPKYLFILGDTFHTKTTTNTTVMQLFDTFLNEAKELVEKIVILVGNHDWGIPYQDHALELYKLIPNVEIVENYYLLDDKNLFLGYCREVERFNKFVFEAQLKSDKIERLFGHLDINGFSLGSGWEEKTSFLDADSLASYKQVFTGHYHLAQEKVLKNGSEIVYIGSGYTTDFGESNQDKRFILLDLDSGNWQALDTGLTYHFTQEMDAKDEFPKYDLEKIKEGIKYRLRITGTKEEIALIDKPKGFPKEVKVVYSYKASKKQRIDLSEKANDSEIMEEYAQVEIEKNYSGLDKSGFDIDKLVEVGKKYL